MNKILLVTNIVFAIILGFLVIKPMILQKAIMGGAPPYGAPEKEVPNLDPTNWFSNWERPEGPPRIGLQIGHLENSELPKELDNIRGNTGAESGGVTEIEVNSAIAEATKRILEERGITVDILPATVPPSYIADAFIAIHADGSLDRNVSGYKIAGPWRDWSGNSDRLVDILDNSYSEATELPFDPNISNNMRGYYAFSWWRYKHSVHPMTPSVIVETGFLTNPGDRELLTNRTEVSAQGIADGIIQFLEEQGIIESVENKDEGEDLESQNLEPEENASSADNNGGE